MDHRKKASLRQERQVAEDIGGSVQPGSGAPEFYKGDARKIGELRVECKTTSNRSFNLKLSELEKIKVEALRGGDAYWSMQIQFQTQTGGKQFAVIDWSTFLYMMKAINE